MITVIKGQTVKINSTVYTDQDKNLRANITGATVSVMLKKSYSDSDSAKLLEKTTIAGVVITSGSDGTLQTVISAADLIAISYNKVYFEILVKMIDGSYIRSGVEEMEIRANVIKTLN